MVVALGALETQPEEALGGQFGLDFRVAGAFKGIVDRATGAHVARVAQAGEKLADHLVPGGIGIEPLVEPPLVGPGAVSEAGRG